MFPERAREAVQRAKMYGFVGKGKHAAYPSSKHGQVEKQAFIHRLWPAPGGFPLPPSYSVTQI